MFRSLMLGLLAVFAIAGCGGSSGPTLVSLSGKVKIDGAAPPQGTSITLIANDGTTNGGGATVVDGAYSIKVPAGKYKVQIRAPKSSTANLKSGGGLTGDMFAELLPAKYNDSTELTVEVGTSSTEKNFELSAKK